MNSASRRRSSSTSSWRSSQHCDGFPVPLREVLVGGLPCRPSPRPCRWRSGSAMLQLDARLPAARPCRHLGRDVAPEDGDQLGHRHPALSARRDLTSERARGLRSRPGSASKARPSLCRRPARAAAHRGSASGDLARGRRAGCSSRNRRPGVRVTIETEPLTTRTVEVPGQIVGEIERARSQPRASSAKARRRGEELVAVSTGQPFASSRPRRSLPRSPGPASPVPQSA